MTFIPISALNGDNVVERSDNMKWFDGTTLLHHLESVYIASDANQIDARFPVQYVIRPQTAEHHDYRGYAGQVAGGVMRPATTSSCFPPGSRSTIAAIDTLGRPASTKRARAWRSPCASPTRSTSRAAT